MEFERIRFFILLFFLGISFWSCEAPFSKNKIPWNDGEVSFNTSKSLSLIENSLKRNPNDASVYFKKASLLFLSGEYTQAKVNLEKALEIEPVNPEYLLFNARILFQEGKINSARYEADKLIRKGGESEGAFEIISMCYQVDKKDSVALTYIDKAISLNPSNPSLYLRKAEICENLQLLSQASDNYHKSISIDANLRAYLKLISLLSKTELLDSLSSVLGKAANSYPENLNFKLAKSDVLEKSGYSDSSISYLKNLMHQTPDKLKIYDKISSSYLKKYFYDSAQYFADLSLEKDSLHTFALLTKARVLERKDNNFNALALYNKILEIEPEYTVAQEEKEKLLNKIAYLRRLEKELEEFREIQKLQPINIRKN